MNTKAIKVNRVLSSKHIAELTEIARNYESEITLESKHYKIDVKSILGLLALHLDKGSEVTINTKGNDGEEALAAITEYLQGDAE